MRHLISLKDYTAGEITEIIELAEKIKANQKDYWQALDHMTLIMLFQKSSTRTRLSFEEGMTQLGGHGIFLDQKTSQFALTDFRDEIQAVMRFGDMLMFRAMKVEDVEKAASLNAVPVIDACSEKYHPCQALSDLLTMSEKSGGLGNIKKVAWLGIENNVSNTLMLACAKLGIEVSIIAPKVNEPSIDEELNKMAEDTGKVTRTLDLEEGLKDADFVHTDTWMDMEFFEEGRVKPDFKEEYEVRIDLFKPYQLSGELIDKYCPEAKIMHCMPCHIGYEISRSAMDHGNAVIIDQAENRLHAQKAIMLWLNDHR
ncbi:ornithine carbamoyltransferase [Patescibacteria group bacterium]|nr:ornithine carbamoyltransferase [Patescibacteria group bacterium]MBU1672881.1 ornithine carbamoyltransferase [Patescibacteria group bacterium]MBU1963132.1 ornithine carbamoyltransferase [Patescibacteria group bacterium]